MAIKIFNVRNENNRDLRELMRSIYGDSYYKLLTQRKIDETKRNLEITLGITLLDNETHSALKTAGGNHNGYS